jgi:hypothetical protein
VGPYQDSSVANHDVQTDTIGAEQLAEIRTAAKTLLESGLLNPHEKWHLWQIIARIDSMRETGQS